MIVTKSGSPYSRADVALPASIFRVGQTASERLAAIADAGMPPTQFLTVDVHAKKQAKDSMLPYPIEVVHGGRQA
jgi:hypothetical protein